MVAIEKIRKAGLLVGSAFLLAGCDKFLEPEPADDFFSPDQGGDPALFQHIFWFFGHPEVYLPFVIIALGLSILAFAKFFPTKWRAIIRAMKWPPSIPALWMFSGICFVVAGYICIVVVEMRSIDQVLQGNTYIRMFIRLFWGATFMSFVGAVIFLGLPWLLRSNYSRHLAWIVWGLWNGGIGMILFPEYFLATSMKPRRYVDYPANYSVLDALSVTGSILCALALATFVVLVIEALVKRRPLRDKSANPTLDAFE